jgi:type I restriction enzyme S subunit
VERHISVIEELKSIVTNTLRRAAIVRQKILRDAFAGKLVPQDPADEPAGILLERIRAEKVEREAEASQVRKERRGKMKGRKAKPSTRKQRRPLREVVVQSKRRLTPEQLFAEAGFTPEVVEVFYEELRSEIEDQHIEQVRPDSAKVYLIAANA